MSRASIIQDTRLMVNRGDGWGHTSSLDVFVSRAHSMTGGSEVTIVGMSGVPDSIVQHPVWL